MRPPARSGRDAERLLLAGVAAGILAAGGPSAAQAAGSAASPAVAGPRDVVVAVPAVAKPAPSPARVFVQRLTRAGRAEASFSRTASDPLGGGSSVTRGQIALEPPDRLSLSFPATGERIAVRGEGGEWLQPALRQMMTLDRAHATAARRWWAVLFGDTDAVALTRARDGRWRVALRGDPEQGAWITFDAGGLPTRLEVDEYGTPTVYRFSGWRFGKPRGRAAFVLRAPAGYEVVALP